MIRKEEGVSTSRFCELFEIPERTWRRWQAKARQVPRVKGPWPQSVRDEVRLVVGEHALQHPVWGYRKIWALTCHDGYRWTAWCFVGRGESLASGCLSCAVVLLLDLVGGVVTQG